MRPSSATPPTNTDMHATPRPMAAMCTVFRVEKATDANGVGVGPAQSHSSAASSASLNSVPSTASSAMPRPYRWSIPLQRSQHVQVDLSSRLQVDTSGSPIQYHCVSQLSGHRQQQMAFMRAAAWTNTITQRPGVKCEPTVTTPSTQAFVACGDEDTNQVSRIINDMNHDRYRLLSPHILVYFLSVCVSVLSGMSVASVSSLA